MGATVHTLSIESVSRDGRLDEYLEVGCNRLLIDCIETPKKKRMAL